MRVECVVRIAGQGARDWKNGRVSGSGGEIMWRVRSQGCVVDDQIFICLVHQVFLSKNTFTTSGPGTSVTETSPP